MVGQASTPDWMTWLPVASILMSFGSSAILLLWVWKMRRITAGKLMARQLWHLGVADLLLAFTVFNYKGLGTDVTGGFVLMHALEGAAFLHDALTRERKVKRVQRSASTRSKRA